jgi:hypothetical protein
MLGTILLAGDGRGAPLSTLSMNIVQSSLDGLERLSDL